MKQQASKEEMSDSTQDEDDFAHTSKVILKDWKAPNDEEILIFIRTNLQYLSTSKLNPLENKEFLKILFLQLKIWYPVCITFFIIFGLSAAYVFAFL